MTLKLSPQKMIDAYWVLDVLPSFAETARSKEYMKLQLEKEGYFLADGRFFHRSELAKLTASEPND